MDNGATVTEVQEKDSQLIDNIPQEIAELINTARAAQAHLQTWQATVDAKLTATENLVEEQLTRIQTVIGEFQKTLQSATYQEWQKVTNTVCNESKQQTLILNETCSQFKRNTTDLCNKVERTTSQIAKGLHHNLQGLRAGDLQQLVDDNSTEVKRFAANANKRITKILKWFHWKNLALVFGLSLMVTLLVSLYIDDEWPWETHNSVVKQRLAGQAVLKAWSHLDPSDRQQIMDNTA